MAFLTLSMAEIFHAFNMRSLKGSIFTVKKQNIILWGASVLSFALTNLVLMVPAIATNVFSLVPLDAKQYFVALGIAFAVIPVVELVKLITNTITKSNKK